MLPFFISDEMGFSDEELLLFSAASGKAVEDTATGNPLVFTTDLAKPLKSLLIPFTPKQTGSGDSSPSNIRPIVPWDELTVKHGGKNLFDVSVMSTRTGVTVEGNTFVGSPYNFRGNGGTIPLKIPKGAKITLSLTANIEASTDGAGFAILFDYSDGTTERPFYTRNSEVEPTYHYGTITAEKDVVGYEFAYYNHSDATWTVKDVQIEIGETATAYEPYVPITETDISFPSPVYGGTLDAVTGVLTVEYAIVALNTVKFYAVREGFFASYAFLPAYADRSKLMCNIYKAVSLTYWDEMQDGQIMGIPEGGIIRIKDESCADVTALETQLTEKNAVLAYTLPEPQTVQLTPSQITALVGNNTLWSDADGSMTAVYFKKG